MVPVVIGGSLITVMKWIDRGNNLWERMHKSISMTVAILLVGGIMGLYSLGWVKSYSHYKEYVKIQNVKIQAAEWVKRNSPEGSVVALVPIGIMSF